MELPEDLFYTKEHEWARVEDQKATIGITYHAQEQLGDIVYLELPEEGSEITKDDSFGVIESVKAVSDLYAPVSGRVLEVNREIVERPETVNTDPYNDGWLIVVQMSDPTDAEDLLSASDYEQLLKEEDEEAEPE